MSEAALQVRQSVRRALLVACACCVLGGSPANAQIASASLSGLITDDTGGALPGVTVTVRNIRSEAV
jgi:hypothetical protein